MASSTQPYDSRKLPTGEVRRHPMAAVIIHAGVLVGLNASGYAEAADSSSLSILGVSRDEYDNSTGSAGDLHCEVEVGVFTFANKSGDALGNSDVGRPAYVSTTSAQGWYEVQSTAGASCRAGILFGFDAETGRPLVDIRNVAVRNYHDMGMAVAKNATATLTAAEITNSGRGNAVITSTTAAAVTLTTPTAAEILAAVPWLPIGGGTELLVQNTGGSNAITMAGGTNVTITANNVTVAASGTGRYYITRTAAAAVTLHRAG